MTTLIGHTAPFVRILLPFLVGILTAIVFPVLPISLFTGVAIVSGALFLSTGFRAIPYRWRWLSGVPLSTGLYAVGVLWTYFYDERQNDDYFIKHISTSSTSYSLGTVKDVQERENNRRLLIKIKAIGIQPDSLLDATGQLLLYVKKDTLLTAIADTLQQGSFEIGQIVAFKGVIRPIEPPKNPDAFNFQRYWHFKNIHYQSFISADDIKGIAREKSFSLIDLAHHWQNRLLQILKKHLTNPREYAVGTALLLGNKDAITDDIREAYIDTGAMHILAVSGMHLLVLFWGIDWLLNRYKSGSRRWQWTKVLIAVVVIWSFALLTGLSASIVRAAVMSSFLSVGRALHRRKNEYNLLAASAFVLLMCNPFWLMDIGFQLSYSAVIGIFYVYPLLNRSVAFKNKISQKVWSSLMISVAAQLVVTPIALFYFHQFPTYFWLSSLLVVPLSEIALLTGIGLLTTHQVPILGSIIGKILFGSIWAMNEIIFHIQALPFNVIDGIWLSVSTIIFLYGAIFGFTQAFKNRKLRLFYYPLSCCLILSGFYAFSSVLKRKNKEIIIYHIPQNSVVEVVDGKKCYRFLKKFSTKKEAETRIKFAVDNYHNRLKISELQNLDFNDSVKNTSLLYLNRCMLIGNRRGLILDRLPTKQLNLPFDFVLVHHGADISVALLKQKCAFQTLIFDASNPNYLIQKWVAECEALGVRYHDIPTKGAWRLTWD